MTFLSELGAVRLRELGFNIMSQYSPAGSIRELSIKANTGTENFTGIFGTGKYLLMARSCGDLVFLLIVLLRIYIQKGCG